MSAREKIFARLKERMTVPTERPKRSFEPTRYADPVAAFKASLEAAGGVAVEVPGPEELEQAIEAAFPEVAHVIDTRKNPTIDREMLEKCDLAILEAEFGVAENGAVWIDWPELTPRALLTMAENLAILLPRSSIVPTMHEAYASIDFDAVSYALFLSGPSKTADIEQALVIGAHGAIGMKVFLV